MVHFCKNHILLNERHQCSKSLRKLQGASKKSWFSGKSAVANITSDREKSISTFAQIHERYLSDLQWSQIQKDCDIFVVEFLLILKLKLCSLVYNDCSRTKMPPRAQYDQPQRSYLAMEFHKRKGTRDFLPGLLADFDGEEALVFRPL